MASAKPVSEPTSNRSSHARNGIGKAAAVAGQPESPQLGERYEVPSLLRDNHSRATLIRYLLMGLVHIQV